MNPETRQIYPKYLLFCNKYTGKNLIESFIQRVAFDNTYAPYFCVDFHLLSANRRSFFMRKLSALKLKSKDDPNFKINHSLCVLYSTNQTISL
jgi:hypothetical protein